MPRRGMLKVGLRVALAALALAANSLTAANTLRLNDSDYGNVAALAAALGLKASWTEPNKKLRLQSEWTQLELTADSREVRLNDVRLLLGEPTVLHKGSLHLSRTDERAFLGPILSANRVPGRVPGVRTVVIDAGHGGKDTGTSNERLGFEEKGFALEVAKTLKRLLEAEGFIVLMTRTEDTFIPLPERPTFANKHKADFFVSVHFNAIANPAIAGAETYIYTPQNQRSTGADKRQRSDSEAHPGHGNNPWNAILGYRVHRRIIADMKSFDRGLKRARFVVLRDLNCPGILVEGGYLSNDAEARQIASPEWRERLAKAIAGGIVEYRDLLEQARAK